MTYLKVWYRFVNRLS